MLEINTGKETEKIVNFIKTTFQKQGFEKAVIAVSGGVDSAACLFLLTKALGPKSIYCLKLPYGKQDMSDADQVIKIAKIPKENIFNCNIAPLVKSFLSLITNHPRPRSAKRGGQSLITDLRLGNIMARTRMILTYDLAKANQALVCGTENRSEFLLGYFTLFGDQACDFSPLQHLYKTQVKQVASYLKVPNNIVNKPPTAGLWLDQTDEQELGFTYEKADQILSLILDQKLSLKQILKQPINRQTLKKVLTRIKANLFKHQIPYTLERKV